MRTYSELRAYADQNGFSSKMRNHLIRGCLYELRGMEHLVGGFMGLHWDDEFCWVKNPKRYNGGDGE